MLDATRTQLKAAVIHLNMVKPLDYKLLKNISRLTGKKKTCEERGESTGNEVELQESYIYIIQGNDETGFEWVTISYKRLEILLGQSKPVLILFYSSKVLSNYHNTSNTQSERCGELCSTLQELTETRVLDKVNLVKIDIEESDHSLQISHLPTIMLYLGGAVKKRYPVEYFGNPCDVSNYKRFLKEEGIIAL